jgi:hypothetical protein
MSTDAIGAAIGGDLHEGLKWKGRLTAAYYAGDWTAEQIDAGLAGAPIDVREADNILVNSGIGLLLDLLIGAGGTTFGNANAYIGIGNSSTAAAANQTDLIGASTHRQAMDATYPQRSGQTLTFRATVGTANGNFAINEAGVFNAASGGTMLNRFVEDLGTKTSATSLLLTVTITIS